MNSCTSALECAIKCQGLNGEIIIPSFTWVSTANVILNAGCTPVFADIDLNSRNIDPKSIVKNITKKTVAIIVVHFAGLPCDMEKIIKICKKYNLRLIEDYFLGQLYLKVSKNFLYHYHQHSNKACPDARVFLYVFLGP